MTGGTSRSKAPQAKGDQGDRVRNLIYSRELPIDDGITLNVDTRPLHTIVDPKTLPVRTELFYDPKKGSFREKRHRQDADEVILRNAQRHQGRLSCHIDTGHCPDPATAGKNSALSGTMGMAYPSAPSYPKSRKSRY